MGEKPIVELTRRLKRKLTEIDPKEDTTAITSEYFKQLIADIPQMVYLEKEVNAQEGDITLREIQNAYEAVIGHKVDTANFRRDIRKMLVPVGKKKKTSGKMAELFRFNPMYTYLEEDL